MENDTEFTTNERILAAVSHGSAIMMGWGIVIPLVIWILQREKSKFVKYHAIQAMLFQLSRTPFVTILFFGFTCVYIAVIFITRIFTAETGAEDITGMIISQVVFIAGISLGMAVYPIIGLIAAGLTYFKRDFRYPLLGSWLKKYLAQESEMELLKDVAHE